MRRRILEFCLMVILYTLVDAQKVVELTTETFEHTTHSIDGDHGDWLIQFTTSLCENEIILNDIAINLIGIVHIGSVNTDENPMLNKRFGLVGIAPPTYLMISQGSVYVRYRGEKSVDELTQYALNGYKTTRYSTVPPIDGEIPRYFHMQTSTTSVITLTESTFDQVTEIQTGNYGVWLIDFHAPWCKHCKTLKPLLEDIAPRLELEDIHVGLVDADEHVDLRTRFRIRSYPTVILFAQGNMYAYNGERTTSSLMSFARGGYLSESYQPIPERILSFDPARSKVIELTRDNFDDITALNSGSKWIIMFHSPNCGPCKELMPIWDEVSFLLQSDDINVGRLKIDKAPEWSRRFGLFGYPSIIVFVDGKMYRAFRGDRSVENLVGYALEDFENERSMSIPSAGETTPFQFHAQLQPLKDRPISNEFGIDDDDEELEDENEIYDDEDEIDGDDDDEVDDNDEIHEDIETIEIATNIDGVIETELYNKNIPKEFNERDDENDEEDEDDDDVEKDDDDDKNNVDDDDDENDDEKKDDDEDEKDDDDEDEDDDDDEKDDDDDKRNDDDDDENDDEKKDDDEDEKDDEDDDEDFENDDLDEYDVLEYNGEIIDLSEKEFDLFIQSKANTGIWFVAFSESESIEWQSKFDIFDSVAESLSSISRYTLGHIDIGIYSRFKKQFSIESKLTLILFSNGYMTKYKDEWTKIKLQLFLTGGYKDEESFPLPGIYDIAKWENKPNGQVIVLTAENFNQVVHSSKPWLIHFHAEWCTHCRRLTFLFKSLATNMKGTIHVGEIDVVLNKGLSQLFRPQTLPAIYFIERGQVIKYKGKRNLDALVAFTKGEKDMNDTIPLPQQLGRSKEWIEINTSSNVFELTDESFGSYMDKNETLLVVFYTRSVPDIIHDIGIELKNNITFGQMNLASDHSIYTSLLFDTVLNKSIPTIFLFLNHLIYPYNNDWNSLKLIKFISEDYKNIKPIQYPSHESIHLLNHTKLNDIINSNNIWLIIFLAPYCEKCIPWYKIINEISNELNFNFGIILNPIESKKSKFQINTFPTILFYNNKKINIYHGIPSKELLFQFLNQSIDNIIIPMENRMNDLFSTLFRWIEEDIVLIYFIVLFGIILGIFILTTFKCLYHLHIVYWE